MMLPHLRSVLRAVAGALLAAVAISAVPASAGAALRLDTRFGPVSKNPVERLTAYALDDFRYDRATRCVKSPTKGAQALVKFLPKISPRGSNWGINRCEMWGKKSASLHAEGRAIDWHLDVNNKADKADAERLIRVLLAPDSQGRPAALARRLGVQGLIWDCKIWFGGSGLNRYGVCTDSKGRWKKRVNKTQAHRDHVHIELSKRGAKMLTSWWKKPAKKDPVAPAGDGARGDNDGGGGRRGTGSGGVAGGDGGRPPRDHDHRNDPSHEGGVGLGG